MATALKLRSDIKKLKKGLEAKGVSASLKEKLKSQLKKAEDELESLKKTGKAPKKSSVAGTKVALTALQKLIQRKKYGVYQGAGVDLKKDAGEGALATGRRESKGLKSNQHGDKSDNKGNVYYEYRPNRLDVKQPKKRQSYPKLEDGGMMARGGEISVNGKSIKLKYVKRCCPSIKNDGTVGSYQYDFVDEQGNPFIGYGNSKNEALKSIEEYQNNFADGGDMAKGGMTKKEAIADYEKEIAMVRNEIKGLRTRLESEDVDNEMSNEKFESLSKRAMMLQRYVNEMNLALNKLKGYDKSYADGGMMAHGGNKKYWVIADDKRGELYVFNDGYYNTKEEAEDALSKIKIPKIVNTDTVRVESVPTNPNYIALFDNLSIMADGGHVMSTTHRMSK